MTNVSQSSELQSKISDKMMTLFENVIKERKATYEKLPIQVATKENIEKIIKQYSLTNAGISGASGLIPGPVGLIAVIPELTLVIKNQLCLICDISRLYGKEEILTKELLAVIFASAGGSAGIGLVTIHGSKLLLKRVSLRAFQKVVTIIGGKLTQQVLKAALAKWIPLAGAGAMAVWTGYMTKKIGEKAIEILQKDIEFEKDIEDDVEIPSNDIIENIDDSPTPPLCELMRMRILCNLAKKDTNITDVKLQVMEQLITSCSLSENVKLELIDQLTSPMPIEINLSAFDKKPDESTQLMIDMVMLAHCDGSLHLAEKMYIKQVGRMVGFSEDDINEMFEEVNTIETK